jgi:hypothetical protein
MTWRCHRRASGLQPERRGPDEPTLAPGGCQRRAAQQLQRCAALDPARRVRCWLLQRTAAALLQPAPGVCPQRLQRSAAHGALARWGLDERQRAVGRGRGARRGCHGCCCCCCC